MGKSNPGLRPVHVRKPTRAWRSLVLTLPMILLGGLGVIGLHLWPELNFWSAQAALSKREYKHARELLERYLEVRPKNAEAHLLLARLDRRMNDQAEAAKHLDACQRMGGPAEAIELERGLSAIQEGDYNPALDKLCTENLARANAEQQYVILEALSQGLTKTYR